MSIRAGVRIGIDVGSARIGVAKSDSDGVLAVPVSTISRRGGDIAELVRIAKECDAVEFVVGLPLSLSGEYTRSTNDAVDFAQQLSSMSGVPVRLVDERLSTVTAQQRLHETGRTTRDSRTVIDQVAATVILQHALDFERSSGRPPGQLVNVIEG